MLLRGCLRGYLVAAGPGCRMHVWVVVADSALGALFVLLRGCASRVLFILISFCKASRELFSVEC